MIPFLQGSALLLDLRYQRRRQVAELIGESWDRTGGVFIRRLCQPAASRGMHESSNGQGPYSANEFAGRYRIEMTPAGPIRCQGKPSTNAVTCSGDSSTRSPCQLPAQ